MTHDEIVNELNCRGSKNWDEFSNLFLADLWYRMCANRVRAGSPLPPDHMRPYLVDPGDQHKQL